jgi:hypothetical protein
LHLSAEFQEQPVLLDAVRARLLERVDQSLHSREACGKNFSLRGGIFVAVRAADASPSWIQ